jgi:hypothetical protein
MAVSTRIVEGGPGSERVRSPWLSPSEFVRPAPPQDAQHLDQLAPDAVGHKIGRLAHHQLTCPRPSTGSSALGKLCKSDCRREDALDLALGRDGSVLGDVGPQRGKVAQGPRRSDYSHSGIGNSSGLPQERTHAATSSCATTRPASASRSPSSIAARCHA